MNANMHAVRTLVVAAPIVLAASAHAQDCSGGPDGGMDATGNQCSHSNPAVANAATPKTNSAARTTATARSIAAACQVNRPEGTAVRGRPVLAANPAAQPVKGYGARFRRAACDEGQQHDWSELIVRRLCGAILAAGWVTLAHASDPAVESLRERGLLEYEKGHYAVAAIHLEEAAEGGDARSAEVLALMYRFGARLYGDQVTVDATKSAHFAAMASERRLIAATSPASTHR